MWDDIKDLFFHEDKHQYDYIIIGAGTAGGVIAKELTDDMKTSVLVLEEGTNKVKDMSSPSGGVALTLSSDNKYSFNILSKLEATLARQVLLSGGRLIGGSSEHNAMLAVRGSKQLYDEWAAISGEQDWDYNHVRKLFKENETYTGDSQAPNERGKQGPIFIRQQNPAALNTILSQATSDTFGIPVVEDYNTGIRDCTFTESQFTHKLVNGQFVRSSTATGYLNENVVTQGNEFFPDEYGVGKRKLKIFAKSTVNKILLKNKHGVQTAVGVDFVRNGKRQVAFAKKGIVVCAGNFSSVILQRSGIGKTADLINAGILPMVENPNVGYNFQTHYAAGMGIEVETSRLVAVMNADPSQPIPLGAFKRDENAGPQESRRLQLLGNLFPRFVPVQDVFINNWDFNANKPTNIMSIGIVDLNPRSKGTILAAHSDPEAYPSVDFNPLANQDDMNYMIDHYILTYNMIKRARELDPAGVYNVVYPNEAIFNLADEQVKRDILARYVKASYNALNHYGGQCRMGKTVDEGVVDGHLNVFGTKNLKVADLSIAPILPDGNTALACQMIGLNAVRFLKMEDTE